MAIDQRLENNPKNKQSQAQKDVPETGNNLSSGRLNDIPEHNKHVKKAVEYTAKTLGGGRGKLIRPSTARITITLQLTKFRQQPRFIFGCTAVVFKIPGHILSFVIPGFFKSSPF